MYQFNITIKCCVHNSISNYSFHILIYDRDKNLIEQVDTTQNQFQVSLKEGIYKFVIISNCALRPSVFCRSIFISEKSSKCFCFFFEDVRNIRRQHITVWLTDSNYSNLVIETGKIILWRNALCLR